MGKRIGRRKSENIEINANLQQISNPTAQQFEMRLSSLCTRIMNSHYFFKSIQAASTFIRLQRLLIYAEQKQIIQLQHASYIAF
jgi:hypothetical protein